MLDYIPVHVQEFAVIIMRMLLSVIFGAGFTKFIQWGALFGDSVFMSHNRFRDLLERWHFGEKINGSNVKTLEQVEELKANAVLASALAEKSKANVFIFVPITALLFIALMMG